MSNLSDFSKEIEAASASPSTASPAPVVAPAAPPAPVEIDPADHPFWLPFSQWGKRAKKQPDHYKYLRGFVWMTRGLIFLAMALLGIVLLVVVCQLFLSSQSRERLDFLTESGPTFGLAMYGAAWLMVLPALALTDFMSAVADIAESVRK